MPEFEVYGGIRPAVEVDQVRITADRMRLRLRVLGVGGERFGVGVARLPRRIPDGHSKISVTGFFDSEEDARLCQRRINNTFAVQNSVPYIYGK